jgi:hypothetical protein
MSLSHHLLYPYPYRQLCQSQVKLRIWGLGVQVPPGAPNNNDLRESSRYEQIKVVGKYGTGNLKSREIIDELVLCGFA